MKRPTLKSEIARLQNALDCSRGNERNAQNEAHELRKKLEPLREQVGLLQQELLNSEQQRQFLEGWKARVIEAERGPIPSTDACLHKWEGEGREAFCRKCGAIARHNNW